MKIGIDARMYGPKQTGIGNYIKYLIDYLTRIDEKNRYYIFLRKQEFAKFQIPNSRFQKILADYPWYSLEEQTLFLKTLLRYPIDIMHFPHFNMPLVYSKPFVVTIHDLTPKFFPGEKVGKSWLRRKTYDLVLTHAIKSARAIITPSQFTKNHILKYFNVKPEKIYVIYEGIPLLHAVRESKSPLPPTLHSKPYILYVGVWRSHKNLEGLLQAFILLKRSGLPHKLVLVGESDIYFKKMKKLWEQLGLEQEIMPVGFQSDEKLEIWYKNAALLVLPSFAEGFGLTPLIALFYGVPVAVSSIPVLREVLGDQAFYFDPSNPNDMAAVIKKALTEKASAKKKLAGAGALAKRYTWEKTAHQTLRIYRSCDIFN